MSMLAASYRRAKVPPDYVKPAPVPVSPAVAPNELREGGVGARLQAQPADPRQQDAARNEPPGAPLCICAENRDFATGRKPDCQAIAPGAPQQYNLVQDRSGPDRRSADPHGNAGGQHRHKQDSNQSQHHAAAHDDAAQQGVRRDFG